MSIFIYLNIYLNIYLYIHIYIYLNINLYIYLYIYVYIYLNIYLYIIYLSINLSTNLSIYLSKYLSIYLSIYLILNLTWDGPTTITYIRYLELLLSPELLVRAFLWHRRWKIFRKNSQPRSMNRGWIFSTSILRNQWPVYPSCFSFIFSGLY